MKYLKLLFCFIIPCTAATQNLVPNNSFDQYMECPRGTNYIITAIPWFQPNTIASSTDYFNECALQSSFVSIPKNMFGYQTARTGSGYAGFAGYAFKYGTLNDTRREYLEVKLNNSLISGKRYIVSFFVSLAEKSYFAIETIGAYFSKDSILYYSPSYMALSQYTPQIINITGVPIRDTMNWVLISDTLIAQGGERFMTIGNFNPDSTSNLDTLIKSNDPNSFAYYYIDDVSIIPDTTTGIPTATPSKENGIFSLHPNPNNGSMYFSYSLNPRLWREQEEILLSFYDITGRKIKTYKLKEGKNVLEIYEPLQAGVYFYKVMVNEKVVRNEKVVVIK